MKYLTRSAAALSVLFVGLLANAETVEVPFAFDVQGARFPAGQYDVSSQSEHGFLFLQSKQYPSKHLAWVAHPSDAGNPHDTVLTFDETGSVAVLKSIQNLQWQTGDLTRTHVKGSGDGVLGN